MIGIYCITNQINGKKYIGASMNVENRWKVHRRIYDSVGDKEYNKALYRAFRKYGIDNFTFEVIEECADKNEMLQKEKELIKLHQTELDGYNETPGGEFGSSKGHCAGAKNGRAKLTEEDVIDIRMAYNNREYMRDIYPKYQDKIAKSSFQSVWSGASWKNIMPEVFTEENKEWHRTKGSGSPGQRSHQSILTEVDVKTIRSRRLAGEDRKEVYLDYAHLISWVTFEQVWYNISWKHVEVE